MITLTDTTFSYQAQPPTLREITLTITPGSFTVIVGASGSGKTTLLKLIAGLLTPTTGTVSTQRVIGMVFQNGALLPWKTARENIVLALLAKGMSKVHASKLAHEALSRVGLADFTDKYPRELSGGQRQRVGIARAIAVAPDILILDEPFSALDIETTAELHKDLLALWKELKLTVVMVSHSIEEAVALAEHVLVVKNGLIAKDISIPLSYPRTNESLELKNLEHEISRFLS